MKTYVKVETKSQKGLVFVADFEPEIGSEVTVSSEKPYKAKVAKVLDENEIKTWNPLGKDAPICIEKDKQ